MVSVSSNRSSSRKCNWLKWECKFKCPPMNITKDLNQFIVTKKKECLFSSKQINNILSPKWNSHNILIRNSQTKEKIVRREELSGAKLWSFLLNNTYKKHNNPYIKRKLKSLEKKLLIKKGNHKVTKSQSHQTRYQRRKILKNEGIRRIQRNLKSKKFPDSNLIKFL